MRRHAVERLTLAPESCNVDAELRSAQPGPSGNASVRGHDVVGKASDPRGKPDTGDSRSGCLAPDRCSPALRRRCRRRRTLTLMAGEHAFGGAVEAHRVITGEHEYDAVWSLLEPLATEAPALAVQIARAGLGSVDASERSVATDLLGLVAGLHRSYRSQVVRRLVRQSRAERHEDVQWSLAMASAHSGDARTFPVLAKLTESSDADVRYQVAQAIGAVADATTKDTAVRLLRLLAADAEEGVRAKAMETLLTLNRPPE